MRVRRPLALLLTALTAAGCGAAPSTTPKRPARPEPAPRILPAPAASLAPDEGARLLAQLQQAFATATGVQGEVKATSEGHWKAGKQVSELRRSTYRTKVLWVKPNKIRGDILETDNMLVSGAKMVTLDGRKVKVRAGGMLGLVPLNLGIGDGMLASNRNHTFAEQMPAELCGRLMGPTAQWTVVGDGAVAGVPVRLVEVSNVKRLDGEITREVIAVDPVGVALRGVAMYAGAKKVVDVSFTSFRWNPKPAADAFEI